MADRLPTTRVLDAIADVVTDTGLRVDDLPTAIQCWIAVDDGDDLGPDVVCVLTDGRRVEWYNNDRIAIGGLVRVPAYARK